jgi:hypothetical protein
LGRGSEDHGDMGWAAETISALRSVMRAAEL